MARIRSCHDGLQMNPDIERKCFSNYTKYKCEYEDNPEYVMRGGQWVNIREHNSSHKKWRGKKK
jgi:hypothetical protein